MQRLGASRGQLTLDPLPDGGVGRRAQLEVREGDLEVEAGAAHDDRAAAVLERGVDLRVCEGGELAGREGLARVEEREQAVLEPLTLLRRRGAREQLEAAVDLERVGRHGQRFLASLAQPLGHRDGDGGLPHAGGAEQGEHVHDRY